MNDAHDRTPSEETHGLASILEWTRRNFLKYVGGAAAAGAVPRVLTSCAQPVPDAPAPGEKVESYSVGPTGEAVSASYVIARASDGFDMQMDLMNLQVVNGQLLQNNQFYPSYVVLRSHPQHTSECVASMVYPGNQTTFISAEEYVDIPSFSSAPSRLVFAIAPGFAGVPFKLNSILSLLSTCPLNIAPNAISDAAVSPSTIPSAAGWSGYAPDPTVTSIELPFRLEISPNEQSRFVHSNPPATLPSSKRVELANSRLAVVGANGLADEVSRTNRTIRALYSRDSVPGQNQNPFLGQNDPYPVDALPSFIRQGIVTQSSAFTWNTAAPQPTSVAVDALMLTPYGGTLQAKGQWEATAKSSLLTWKHETSIGRDDFVQATLLGYVLPFGLRAIVTMTVQRQLNANTNPFVTLFATWVLHLVDTCKDFSPFPGLPLVGHRAMPFQHVQAHQTTFQIDAPPQTQVKTDSNGVQSSTLCFPAQFYGAPIFLPMTGIDRRGRSIKFQIPIYWTDVPSVPSAVATVNNYPVPNAAGAVSSTNANVISLNRQRVGIAPSTKDHTTIEADWMAFKLMNMVAADGVTNTFYPSVCSMSGVAEATRALAGADQPILMSYHSSYAPAVTASNAASQTVPGSTETANNNYVAPVPTTALLTFGSNVGAQFTSSKGTGGLALPSATFGAIGLTTGLANNVNDILPVPGTSAPPTPSWSQLLGGAKLFGEIDLAALAQAASGGKVPKFVSEAYSTAERYAAELELLVDPDHGLLAQLSAASSTIASQMTALQTALTNIVGALGNLPAANIAQIGTDVASVIAAVQPGGTLDSALAGMKAPYSGISRAARNQLQKVASAVGCGGPAIQAALTAMQAGLECVRDQKAKIDWSIPIPGGQGIPSNSLQFITTGTPNSTFTISVELNGKAPDAGSALKLFCALDNFTLNFPPIASPWLKLHFDRIFFNQQPGQKTEIDVVFGGIDFLQCLQWVDVIQSLIPSDGFSDPPHVDITDDGIDAGFTCGLPSVCAGMLSFENMKLSADLNVPFIGKAITFTFAFCDRDHPFTVTVSFLGGGGYFTITMASSGDNASIQQLEASFSVCAQLAFDIVIASGSLSARAGVTVTYDQSTGVSLTAFVDLRGALDILGLIQASIEAYLGLTYDFGTNSLTGECKLILSIELFGLSKSVTLDFKQTFAGSSSGPSSQSRFHGQDPTVHVEDPTAPAALPMPSPSFTDLFTDPNPVVGQPPLQTRWTQYCSYFV